jgi:hypothetical protein
MLKKFVLASIFSGFGILSWAFTAQAGFGISPPYVKSDKIIPGTHYEQRIVLLRSSAEEALTAEITVNAPEISSWISLNKGETFDLPKNELQVPMIVMVDVPKDADIGKYTGYINVRIAPKDGQTGGVAIALGARIDIDLNVTNETFPDFIIKELSIPDFEVLKAPWKWPIFSYFFYRSKVVMKIENTGNVKIAPTKVHLDIYALDDKTLLESGIDKSIKKINPFETQNVEASFPTKLKVGQYWGKIKIYKGEEIVRNDKVVFTVLPSGTLLGGNNLGIWPWLMLFGLIIILLFIIFGLIKLKFWKYAIKALYIIAWPILLILKKIISLLGGLKIKFWKWMHKKASRYQDNENAKDFRKRK